MNRFLPAYLVLNANTPLLALLDIHLEIIVTHLPSFSNAFHPPVYLLRPPKHYSLFPFQYSPLQSFSTQHNKTLPATIHPATSQNKPALPSLSSLLPFLFLLTPFSVSLPPCFYRCSFQSSIYIPSKIPHTAKNNSLFHSLPSLYAYASFPAFNM